MTEDLIIRMKSKATDGSEFNNGLKIEGEDVIIGHTNCDYCNSEILGVWDKNNINEPVPYLGNQARRPNTYKYSKIISMMRNHFGCNGEVWNEENGNNLLNSHARLHSDSNENFERRVSDDSSRLLCNKCFQKTYNRIKILGNDNITYAISVIEDRGETTESVMRDLNIEGVVLGKGGISDYGNK